MKFSVLIVAMLAVTTADFLSVVEQMEADVLELRHVVEALYRGRCDRYVLQSCQSANYHECNSQFPHPSCPATDASDDRIKDFTIPVTRVARAKTGADGNPTDPQVIEAICYSRQLDSYFREKHESDLEYWTQLGVPTPQRYFGSNHGTMQIYPARYAERCDNYDPRLRPWFVAASSGPKNIMLLLDVSGSMQTDDRIGSLKHAAKVIVNTLTVTDRVVIVPFSDTATTIADRSPNGDEILFQATQENKAKLVQAIDDLEAFGRTNFLSAFEAAFQVFNNTHSGELTKDCTTAVLFLTDGRMSHPPNVTEDQALETITGYVTRMEEQTENPVFLFTYSVAFDEVVHEFPKRLACSTKDGVWSRIGEAQEIFDSLTGYTRLLGIGLGDGANEDFTAWVEPYQFSSGVWGVTVSAPVFDWSKAVPQFLGVVGVDNTLEVFTRLLEEEGSNKSFLEAIAARSAAKCPRLDNIPECVLESYRRQGKAGDEALCGATCSDSFPTIEEFPCPDPSNHPSNVWNKTTNDVQGSSQCPQHSKMSPAIVGSIITPVLMVAVIAAIVLAWRKMKARPSKSLMNVPPMRPPPPINPNYYPNPPVSAPPADYDDSGTQTRFLQVAL